MRGNTWRLKTILSVPIIPLKNKESSQTDTFLTQVSLKLNSETELKMAVLRWLLRSLGESSCADTNQAFREQISDPLLNEKVSAGNQAKILGQCPARLRPLASGSAPPLAPHVTHRCYRSAPGGFLAG